ncbi:MAG: hypothetical protein M5U22_20100 [Thermoleophilia bacterium]|nr:hypothetical protein [Thermoleophilia bacterium]
MWVIVHTVSGAALGVAMGDRLGQPLWVVVVAALAAHSLLDLVPHWDYTGHRLRPLWAGLDVAASSVAFLAGWRILGLETAALVAAAVSAAPDLDVLDAVLPYSRSLRVFPSHWKRFPHGQATQRLGLTVQAAVVSLSLVVILALR